MLLILSPMNIVWPVGNIANYVNITGADSAIGRYFNEWCQRKKLYNATHKSYLTI